MHCPVWCFKTKLAHACLGALVLVEFVRAEGAEVHSTPGNISGAFALVLGAVLLTATLALCAFKRPFLARRGISGREDVKAHQLGVLPAPTTRAEYDVETYVVRVASPRDTPPPKYDPQDEKTRESMERTSSLVISSQVTSQQSLHGSRRVPVMRAPVVDVPALYAGQVLQPKSSSLDSAQGFVNALITRLEGRCHHFRVVNTIPIRCVRMGFIPCQSHEPCLNLFPGLLAKNICRS